MEHGKYTKELGKKIYKYLREKKSLFNIYYDHGDTDIEPNTCEPTPYFSDKCSDATSLSNIDIAIVDEIDKKVILICEIEEEGGSPKKIIGDICGIFLTQKIRIKGKDYGFDRLHFIFGIKINKKGKSAEKAKELESRIPKIIRPELIDKIKIQFVYGTNYDALIKNIEKELAVKLFSEGKTTIGESAEIAELSVGEMMELLADRGIKSKITLKDYEEGLATAIEAI